MNHEEIMIFFLSLGLIFLTFLITLGIMGLVFWFVDRRRVK